MYPAIVRRAAIPDLNKQKSGVIRVMHTSLKECWGLLQHFPWQSAITALSLIVSYDLLLLYAK